MKKVESKIIINASPQDIIDAFLEFEQLKKWWNVERVLIEKKNGGIYSLAWNISEKGFKYISTGIINSYKPAHHLYISDYLYFNPEKQILGPMSLKVEVKEKKTGTELYLCQDGYRDSGDWEWYFESVKNAWPAVMQELKKFLEKN
ncbi:MAG: SRPBCC domain-containing protein [Ignavibacteriales bacterium]|nr:MAG: SRPBCC domain-containing protein [Ignavibacteriales bacterium]